MSLAINMVMAGCLPEYADVVRTAMPNDLGSTSMRRPTHMVSPVIVNGQLRAIGMMVLTPSVPAIEQMPRSAAPFG